MRTMLIALMLIGCAHAGTRVTEDQVKRFVPGKTTYTEVVKALGTPTSETFNVSGKRTAFYTYATASLKGATFIPVIGLFAGGTNMKSTTASFEFDTHGVLLDYSTGQGAMSSGMGTGQTGH